MESVADEFCAQVSKQTPYLSSLLHQLASLGDVDLEEEKILISPLKSYQMENDLLNQNKLNSDLKTKVDNLNNVADQLRKDYYKEINHYKEQERMRKNRLVNAGQLYSIEDEEERISIPVEYFDFLTGLD